MKPKVFIFICVTAVMSGCYDSDSTDSTTATTATESTATTLEATFASIHTNVLAKSCAISGCHVSGATAPNMEASVAYANLVDQLSTQATGLKYITPFSSDESYIVHKISGSQATKGGSGSTMPRGSTALTPETIAIIVNWIVSGAENN
jgi:hypothetical protein